MKSSVKKSLSRILGELWQTAVFNPEALSLFKKITSTSRLKPTLQKQLADDITTIRNRNLITNSQQKKLRDTVVGFFGLSVGSHSAVTWMTESRASAVKIVDFDTIDPSNLNRLRFGWDSVGQYKTDATKNLLTQINPFANIISSTQTDPDTFARLFTDSPRIDVVVDAIDDLAGKILLRRLAKKHHLPLISAADVGDNVMLDIERYDQKPKPAPFHGRIDIDDLDFQTLSPIKQKQLIIKLIGFEQNHEQLLESLNQIGHTLATWPQLAATATIAGGITTTVIKKIILGEAVHTGRYYFSLDSVLVSDFNSKSRQKYRQKLIAGIKKDLDL